MLQKHFHCDIVIINASSDLQGLTPGKRAEGIFQFATLPRSKIWICELSKHLSKKLLGSCWGLTAASTSLEKCLARVQQHEIMLL